MIYVYVKPDAKETREIHESLKTLVLAHKMIPVKDLSDIPAEAPDKVQLPFVLDDGRIVQGAQNIKNYLEEMEDYKKEWDKFQSDACYCDDEGNVE